MTNKIKNVSIIGAGFTGIIIYEIGGFQLSHRPANLFYKYHPVIGEPKSFLDLNGL